MIDHDCTSAYARWFSISLREWRLPSELNWENPPVGSMDGCTPGATALMRAIAVCEIHTLVQPSPQR